MADMDGPVSPPRLSDFKPISSSSKRLEDEEAEENAPSPKSALEFPNKPSTTLSATTSESEDEDEDDDDDVSESDLSATDLIQAARGRMEQQKLMEELTLARKTIQGKETEIKQLSAQLHMAISTKRDLVDANQELEERHEVALHNLSRKECDLKRSSLAQQEVRAEVEKEFLNELTDLANKVAGAEKKRIRDLKKKDEIIEQLQQKLRGMEQTVADANKVKESEARLIQACAEKEERIFSLQEKVNKLEREGRRRRDSDKVQYYKVRLGLESTKE